MANRLTPALLVRETKHFVNTRNFNLNRDTATVLLLGLAIAVLFFLPNRDRIAFEAVQIGMPREVLAQTLAGRETTAIRSGDEETQTWRDQVKFPIRKYQVTLHRGRVTAKQELP